MIFSKNLALVIISLVLLACARGPTFPIGDGGLVIAHGGVVAREAANIGLLARDGLLDGPVSAVSYASEVVTAFEIKTPDPVLASDALTVIEESTTTTILTTMTVSPVPLSSFASKSSSLSTVSTQLSEMASTSSLVVAITAFLSSSESISSHSVIDQSASTTQGYNVTISTANTTVTQTPITATQTVEIPLFTSGTIGYSTRTQQTHTFVINSTTSTTTQSYDGVLSKYAVATQTPISSIKSVRPITVTQTEETALFTSGTTGYSTITETRTFVIDPTTSTTQSYDGTLPGFAATVQSFNSLLKSVMYVTIPVVTGGSTSWTTAYQIHTFTTDPSTKTTRSYDGSHPTSLEVVSAASSTTEIVTQPIDFSGRAGPAPYQTGGQYQGAAAGNKDKARNAAKASVFAGIALGVWMVIRIFLN